MSDSLQLHASCVNIDGKGVLFLGPSGSGKSDLALRLIDGGATLVGDDQVQIRRINPPPLEGGVRGGGLSAASSLPPTPPSPSRGEGILLACPCERIHGMLEARGVGILHLPYVEDIPLALAVRLVERDMVERMPEHQFFDCLGMQVPLLSLHAFDSSTPAKIRLYLRHER